MLWLSLIDSGFESHELSTDIDAIYLHKCVHTLYYVYDILEV